MVLNSSFPLLQFFFNLPQEYILAVKKCTQSWSVLSQKATSFHKQNSPGVSISPPFLKSSRPLSTHWTCIYTYQFCKSRIRTFILLLTPSLTWLSFQGGSCRGIHIFRAGNTIDYSSLLKIFSLDFSFHFFAFFRWLTLKSLFFLSFSSPSYSSPWALELIYLYANNFQPYFTPYLEQGNFLWLQLALLLILSLMENVYMHLLILAKRNSGRELMKGAT